MEYRMRNLQQEQCHAPACSGVQQRDEQNARTCLASAGRESNPNFTTEIALRTLG
jgi:hypothetical protein